MNFEDIVVRVNKPYPEVEDAIECKKTVAVLKNLATARYSELSAILQYNYQASIADRTREDIAEILQEISIVEMTHLDMLMHAIVDFGGVPKYEDSQGQIFNTSGVNYNLKLKEILDINIEGERQAINAYKQAIEMVQNKSLKELFARIIEDEARHIEVFKTIRDNVTFLAI
ncbi:MAG: ferritin-like domain-containing protein [Clostridia bacterium]|nr:ferritin-like domain-containing protein [Clostridia bacterium]